ncbi:MAG: hypothetical protein AAFY22_10980 [Pseudomonadota bacterium]
MTKNFKTIIKEDERLNIMREFRIDEISVVDRPAQALATATIMKREGSLADEAREDARIERARIIDALESQKTTAGRDVDALREVLDRAQSINFQLGDDPMPELVDFIRVLNQDIVALGEEEKLRSEQRAEAGRITTKSAPSLIRKAAQVEAMAERLAKSSAPSRDDILELKKFANDTCSEFMVRFDSIDAALADADVQRMYAIADQLDGLAARTTP